MVKFYRKFTMAMTFQHFSPDCFEAVRFEANDTGAPVGTLHRISPTEEVLSRMKAGKLFRWAKDACSAVEQQVLAKFAICILDHEKHKPLETYNFYFTYLPNSILFKADSEIVLERTPKDPSQSPTVNVCRTTDGLVHPRSQRRVWGRPREVAPQPFTIEAFLSLFASCGEVPEDYYLSHALFYNDSEAAKTFKPSSDFASYGVAEHGDETEGGFNLFLAAQAAAIGAATAPAAGGAAAQPAIALQAGAGQQVHSTAAGTAAHEVNAETVSPSAQGQSPLYEFGGGGAVGAAGAGVGAEAGARAGAGTSATALSFAPRRAVAQEKGSLFSGSSAEGSAGAGSCGRLRSPPSPGRKTPAEKRARAACSFRDPRKNERERAGIARYQSDVRASLEAVLGPPVSSGAPAAAEDSQGL
jgi:hypothetical protein